MRQIVLDTETTGLDPKQGHRIIEIGCVEIENRRLTGNHYHCYLNPQREIDAAAVEVHGITTSFLRDKPLFAQVANEFIEFVEGAELVIHNAAFDMGFLNNELLLENHKVAKLETICGVLDTLALARHKHPGQRNNLDALCKRYGIDNSSRQLHGALLDAEILADVYLIMTSGQRSFFAAADDDENDSAQLTTKRSFDANRPALKIVSATQNELDAHAKKLEEIAGHSDGASLWSQLEST